VLEQLFKTHASYAYKWLIEITQGDEKIYLINDTKPIIYEDKTFLPSSFGYAPKEKVHGFDGEGSLKITTVDNNLIYWLERNENIQLKVIAVMVDDVVQEVKVYNHQFCSATWNAKEITLNFKKDDRLNMAFPSLIYSAHTNRR